MNIDERRVKEIVLSTVTKCGSCGREYTIENVSILGHEEELWFLMIVCDGCNSRGLIAALIKEQKQRPMITELSEEQFSKFAAKVGADDVLAMHEFLKGFDGDFVNLFDKKEGAHGV